MAVNQPVSCKFQLHSASNVSFWSTNGKSSETKSGLTSSQCSYLKLYEIGFLKIKPISNKVPNNFMKDDHC